MSSLEDHEAEQAMLTALCEAGLCNHPECHEDQQDDPDVTYYANKDQAWWDEWNRNKGAAYREELTPAGPQLVIPGCEPRDKPKSAQLSLWP